MENFIDFSIKHNNNKKTNFYRNNASVASMDASLPSFPHFLNLTQASTMKFKSLTYTHERHSKHLPMITLRNYYSGHAGHFPTYSVPQATNEHAPACFTYDTTA